MARRGGLHLSSNKLGQESVAASGWLVARKFTEGVENFTFFTLRGGSDKLGLSWGACMARMAATGPASMGQSQAACKSAAAMLARMAPSSLGFNMCPSGLGAALRNPAREDRLPEPAAKPGARCIGQ